jgi:hypothetical protein
LEKALAFKKSCAGLALTNANAALQSKRTGLMNTDNNNADATQPRATFWDLVVDYCQRYGHTEDTYNQRKGILHLQKPLQVKVQRWATILKEKNNLVNYLVGSGTPYTGEEMNRIFFESMPLKWQESFTSNGNNDISPFSYATILTFMKQQEATSKAKIAANKAEQLASSNSQHCHRG